jgi:Putative beta-barrel porin-2, OmpL-like. bbp2
MKPASLNFRAWLTAATFLTGVAPAMAQTATPAPAAAAPAAAAPAAADAPPPGYWINGIHLSAQIEAGIIANPADPKLNVGQSLTDHPNQVLLNQVLLGAEKKIDPKATGMDWGFKLSVLYGSDARYTHFLGFLDQAVPASQRNQFDVVEASGTLHFPNPAMSGGLDVKAGLYATPLGAELIDPSTNPFYSHSYIFNFGPYKHMGLLATAHMTDLVDIYGGLDTGTNTTFGPQGDDNNAIGGIIGFGLNMMDGNLTVLALSHIGAENASRALDALTPPRNAGAYMRYYNDVVVVWKANDKLTLTTEADWYRDDFGTSGYAGKAAPANAFAVAQYAAYAITDTVTLNARAEIFRDDNGFFVTSFPGNYDPVRAQKGLSNGSYASPAATYGALTLGVTYKPAMPSPVTALAIRPEIRYDQSLGGNNVFNRAINPKTGAAYFKDSGAFTVGTDVVLTF